MLESVIGVSQGGRWWGQVPTGQDRKTEERELDIAGVDARGALLVAGMCKWTGDA